MCDRVPESSQHEKVLAEKRVKEADNFLKRVEAAKKAGADKARVGTKTVGIPSLLKSAESNLSKREADLKKAKVTYKKVEKIGSKALDLLLGHKKKTTKKKSPAKKKAATKKKSTTKKKVPKKYVKKKSRG